jgi:hypothetical protein
MPEIGKKDPNMYVADTVEEFAAKTGINAAVLKKAIEEYNEVCENGRDKVFHKNAKYLRPIKEGKLFAGKCAFEPTERWAVSGSITRPRSSTRKRRRPLDSMLPALRPAPSLVTATPSSSPATPWDLPSKGNV